MTWQTSIKRFSRWLAISMGVFLLLLGIVFGLAQTEAGKRQVARLLTEVLSIGGEIRAEVGKIEGFIPFEFRLDRLVLRDAVGQWLTLEGVALHLSPFALLRGSFHINELSAAIMQLTRLPAGGKESEPNPKSLSTWPKALERLTVDRLAIGRLAVGTAVLGESAIFKVEAKFMAVVPGEERVSSLRIERTDGFKARAIVTVKVRGEPPVIVVDAEVTEAPGGLAAQALRCEGPVVFALHGEGPVHAWKGRLNAELGGLGRLRTVLEVEARNDVKLVANGTLGLASEFVSAGFRPILGAESRFGVEARLLRTKAVVLERLTLKSQGGVDLQVSGSVDLKERKTRAEFGIRCDDLGCLRDLIDPTFGGSMVVQGTVSGPLLQPQATLAVKLHDVEVANLRAAAMDGNLRVEFLRPVGSPVPGLHLRGTGNVKDFTVQDSGLPGQIDLSWTLEGERVLEKTIHIRQLHVAGEEFTLDLSGRVDPDGPSCMVETALAIRDLRWLSGLLGFELPAGSLLQAEIEGHGQTRSLSARIQGKINTLGQTSPSLEVLLGSKVSYTGEVMFAEAKKLTLSEFELDAATAKLTGTALLDLKDNAVTGSWHLVVPELAVLSPALKRSVGGWLQVDGEMQGPLNMVRLNAEARGRNLLFDGLGYQEMSATLRAEALPPKTRGHFRLELLQAEQALRATADYAMEGPSLSLSTVSVEAGANELIGRLTLDLDRHLVQGALQGKCERLSDLSPFIGEKIAGSAALNSQFEIVETGQQITFKLTGSDVTSRFGEVDSLSLRGRLTRAFKAPRGTAELELHGFRVDDLSLASLVLRAEGNGQRIAYTGRTNGHYMEDFELDTSGVVATTQDHNRLEIGRLQASYGNFPVTLARPVSVLRTPKGYNVEGFAFNLGTGYLEGSWSSGEKTMTMTATFERLPLGPLRLAGVPDLAGTATGTIRFNGQPGEPDGSLEVRFEGLALRDPQFQDLPPATLTTRAKLQKGRLNTGIILEGLKEPFEAQLDIPLELSASPLGWSLPPQGRLHGELSGKLDLALIPLLMSLDDQSVEGRLEINLALRGTVDAPEITGKGRIESGAYENLRSGTLFKDVDILFATKTLRLSIEHACATDGEGGMITAQGWIDLLPNRDFPFSIEVVMDQAILVRLDNATAAAGGQLRLSGSLRKVLLAGQLQIRQAELRIPDRLPPEITELQVIEIQGVGEKTEAQPTQSRSRERDVQLDVKVVSLGRVFLRGRGLDSEWQGDLKISGKASEPVITGRLSVVRGHLNFLGKRFVLSQGLLTMDGTVPPSPHLDVIAEASAKDMTARLNLFGSALTPEVTLSSEPELPSDEILSRLLFGRSVSDITPVQAVNLAYAATRLTGGGDGFDLMGGTRRLLGVDQLEVKQSGERIEETTVSAGKYLSEGVYLEVEKGVGPESGKTSVEVEITPNVTLESEIGENAEGGVGLNWKLNY